MRTGQEAKASTAMSEALRSAGYVHPAERLQDAANRVLDVASPNYLASAERLLTAIREDADLLWELMGPARERLAIDYLNRLYAERDARRKQEAGRRQPERAGGAVPNGGAGTAGLRGVDRPAHPTPKPFVASPSPKAPPPSRAPGEPRNSDLRMPKTNLDAWKPGVAAALEADRRKSKLYTFLINGQPLAEVTAAEARAWASARSRDAYFVRLVVEGVQDSMKLGEAFKGDAWREVEKLYRRAEGSDRA